MTAHQKHMYWQGCEPRRRFADRDERVTPRQKQAVSGAQGHRGRMGEVVGETRAAVEDATGVCVTCVCVRERGGEQGPADFADVECRGFSDAKHGVTSESHDLHTPRCKTRAGRALGMGGSLKRHKRLASSIFRQSRRIHHVLAHRSAHPTNFAWPCMPARTRRVCCSCYCPCWYCYWYYY